jgi:alpha-L-rhamnosidase
VLGRTDEQARYSALAAEVRAAFNREYVTPNGRVISDATTGYALAIEFALLNSAEQRQYAGARLVALVRDSGYRISTGFVGTPLICDALCHVGAYDTAFRLLNQRECPSWLYPVTMGATTIWERWDSLLPDGSVNPGQMTSFNHYALGAVADWLHRTVAGLALAAPGYRRLEVRPLPGGGLTHARARHRTPYGMAAAGWALADGQITVDLLVPTGVTAGVALPGDDAVIEVGPGAHRWVYPYQIPEPVRLPLTLDSTFADLADEPATMALVLVTIRKRAPELASAMESGQGRSGMTLRHMLSIIPNSSTVEREIEAALAEKG